MKRFAFLLAIFVVGGCATMYSAPTATAPRVDETFEENKAEVFSTVQQVLALEGYEITNANEEAGTITTAPRNFDVQPEQADCGSTAGLNYLQDNRTETQVSINALVEENSLLLRANIQGVYRPQNTALECVSKGPIERNLLEKVEARLAE